MIIHMINFNYLFLEIFKVSHLFNLHNSYLLQTRSYLRLDINFVEIQIFYLDRERLQYQTLRQNRAQNFLN